jgi:hypothetical protein
VLDDMVDSGGISPQYRGIVTTTLTTAAAAPCASPISPRARQFGRVFWPPQMIRSSNRSPARAYGPFRPTITTHPFAHHSIGSNHIQDTHDSTVVRLTCDAPLSFIEHESPFVLTRPLHLVFGANEQFQGDLTTTCREFCDRTVDYWMEWCAGFRSLRLVDEIIRSAITPKLEFPRDRRHHRRPYHIDPRSASPAAPGTTAIAGCATPTLS